MNLLNSDYGYRRDATRSLLDIYFGTHADKYSIAQARLSNPPRRIDWNWGAALGGPVWLFYRKLYLLLFIWLLIGVPADFIYFAAARLDPDLSHPLMASLVHYYVPLSLMYILVSNILLGCWGTYLYLRQSQQIVDLVKAKAPATIAAAILAEKGNPSYWRLVGGTFLIAGIYFSTYFLAQLWQAGSFTV